jgi:hypothetical protein
VERGRKGKERGEGRRESKKKDERGKKSNE